MTTTNDTGLGARHHLAVIREHQQPIDFKYASELLAPERVNDATRDAISRAHSSAWDALTSESAPQRVRDLPAVALIEAKEIITRAVLLAMAEYLEEFDQTAAERADVSFEIASLVFLLRTTPAAVAPNHEGWALRGLPSTMRHSPKVPND